MTRCADGVGKVKIDYSMAQCFRMIMKKTVSHNKLSIELHALKDRERVGSVCAHRKVLTCSCIDAMQQVRLSAAIFST